MATAPRRRRLSPPWFERSSDCWSAIQVIGSQIHSFANSNNSYPSPQQPRLNRGDASPVQQVDNSGRQGVDTHGLVQQLVDLSTGWNSHRRSPHDKRDGREPAVLPERPAHCQPIEAGHHVVSQHKIGKTFFCQCQPGKAVGSCQNPETRFFQKYCPDIEQIDRIIHQKDERGRRTVVEIQVVAQSVADGIVHTHPRAVPFRIVEQLSILGSICYFFVR